MNRFEYYNFRVYSTCLPPQAEYQTIYINLIFIVSKNSTNDIRWCNKYVSTDLLTIQFVQGEMVVGEANKLDLEDKIRIQSFHPSKYSMEDQDAQNNNRGVLKCENL